MVLYEGAKLILVSAIFGSIGASSEDAQRILVRLPRQTHAKSGQPHDQSSAETGFLGGGGGVENSKYFHYQHLPEHDKYEFGHRRGNEHHVIERYEKAVPHEGQFKTKVRWADKKGGHGEHYWDYNHAGHGGGGGGGGGGNGHGDGDGGYSDPVPVYSDRQNNPKSVKQHHKRQSETKKQLTLEDVELKSSENFRSREVEGVDVEKELKKEKRASRQGKEEESGTKGRKALEGSQLYLDLKSGQVIDEATGNKYNLQPVH